MTGRLIAIAALLLTAACPKTAPVAPPTTGDAAPEVVPDAAAQVVPLPEDWTGQGVLAHRKVDLPPRAPEWAKVTAEIIERDGRRYLVASGHAERIRNPALARATAENRARAEIARWTVSDTVTGAMIVDAWFHPETLVTFSRLELEVPADWVPGRTLPSVEQAQVNAPTDGDSQVPATP